MGFTILFNPCRRRFRQWTEYRTKSVSFVMSRICTKNCKQPSFDR